MLALLFFAFYIQFMNADALSHDVLATEVFLKKEIAQIHKNIAAASATVEDWTSELNQKKYDFLCLGETHDLFFREFYASVISKLQFDNMALEITVADLQTKQKEFLKVGEVDFLGAPFSPLLKIINSKKSELGVAIDILPLEVTPEQSKIMNFEMIEKGTQNYSRDGFIAENVIKSFQQGEKTVAVYGKNHCSMNNIGLGSVPFFNFLKRFWVGKTILSVAILKRNEGKPHPLVSYLEFKESFKKIPYVVDMRKLQPEDYNFNWDILTLSDNFDYIIVY